MNKDIREQKISYSTYVSVIAGVIAGCLFFFLMMKYNPDRVMECGLENYKMGATLDLPVLYLIFYVLKRRVGQLMLFVLLVILSSYFVAVACYCFGFGLYYGVVLCNLLVKFGIHGLFYGIVCFFPHYLIYFLTMYLAGKWFFIMSSTNCSCTNVNKLQKFVKYFVIITAIMVAIIWEIKFQKNILNYFYQYLV